MDLYKHFPHSQVNFSDAFVEYSPQLAKHQISTMDMLTTAPVELAQRTGIPQRHIQTLVDTLVKETTSRFETTTGPRGKRMFSTGIEKFDDALGGGIHLGQITEIFGEAATGKSQMCMTLTKAVSQPIDQGGLDACSVYISTEGNLETKRLVEINGNLDRVFCINCTDLEYQEHIIEVQLPLLIERNNIKLVVIDSISHHLRVELESTGYKNFLKNKQKLSVMCKKLLDICCEKDIALVVTNQMSELPEREVLQTDYKNVSMDYQIGWLSGWNGIPKEVVKGAIPTLGLSWSNNVMVRICLKKSYQRGEEEFWAVKRLLKLVYSPYQPEPKEVTFKLTTEGIKAE